MGDVKVTLKIYPENPDNIEKIKEEINKIVKLAAAEEQDIGFGVKALRIAFIINDASGVDEIEERIAKIEGVSQVQPEGVDIIG